MTAGQTTRRLSNLSLAPAPLAALLAATLLGGAMIGSAITLQLGSNEAAAPALGGVQPAAVFDAVQFRAGERNDLAPQAPFDAVQFRAGERNDLAPQAPFDAVQFRAGERARIGGP